VKEPIAMQPDATDVIRTLIAAASGAGIAATITVALLLLRARRP
jgi:hypothetical protein